jgi:hypothetical protein
MVMISVCDCVKYGCCVCKWIDKPKPCPGNFQIASEKELMSRMDNTDDELEYEYIRKILNEEYGEVRICE